MRAEQCPGHTGRSQEGGQRREAVAPRPPSEASEPSLVQERLWLVNQMAVGSAATNIPLVCRFRGAIDRAALKQALSGLVRDHAVLRTRFSAERWLGMGDFSCSLL